MINIKNSHLEHQQAEKNTTESDLDYTRDIENNKKQRDNIEPSNQLKFDLIVKQQKLVRRKISKLFRKKIITKLDKQIQRTKANQTQLKRFQKKYPLTYKKSFQQSTTQQLRFKFFTKLSAEDLTCFPLDDYEYDQEDLKRDEKIIRMSNIVRVMDVLKIIEYQIKLKGNSTFIYKNKIQKTIPFHIFSEVVFVTQSYFKLNKIKNNYLKIENQIEQQQFFDKEFQGVSQKDQRSFFKKSS